MRFWVLILLSAALAACAPARPAARYQIGVSGDRLASATTPSDDAAMRRFLDRKARQICTSGYHVVKVATLSAETGRQIVQLDLQCNVYRPDFASEWSSLGRMF